MKIFRYEILKAKCSNDSLQSINSKSLIVHGIGARLVSNWEQNMLYTES